MRMHGHAAPRRLPLRAGRDARGVRGAFDPVERLAARLALDGLGAAEIEGCARPPPARSQPGLRRPKQAPAPDPATLEDGVYAAPPFA